VEGQQVHASGAFLLLVLFAHEVYLVSFSLLQNANTACGPDCCDRLIRESFVFSAGDSVPAMELEAHSDWMI
jgi:hypothetical protein